ncbi:MAG: hypothetical protein E7544_01875 [Ruminococcaceae bacterium]|nr:hypothetical protein [Oscillospiraceae bacterium]
MRNDDMAVYKNAVKVIEEYLTELCVMDASEHVKPGKYRVVFNNWEGHCESSVVIYIDPDTMRLIYKMYYNVNPVTEEQKTTLTDHFHWVNETFIRDRCTGGIEDNGAIYVKVEHSCALYGLTSEHIKMFEKICTERIVSDRFEIKKFIKG